MLFRLLDHGAGNDLVAVGFNGGGLSGLLPFECCQGGRKVIHRLKVIGVRGSLFGRGRSGNGCSFRNRRGNRFRRLDNGCGFNNGSGRNCQLRYGHGSRLGLRDYFRGNLGDGRGFSGNDFRRRGLGYGLGWGIGVQR